MAILFWCTRTTKFPKLALRQMCSNQAGEHVWSKEEEWTNRLHKREKNVYKVTTSTLMILRPCPLYAEEIWKHNFTSTVRLTIHTNPSRKRSFPKSLFKPEEFQTRALHFTFSHYLVRRKLFKGNDISIFRLSFFKHKYKMTADCCVFNFSGVVWTEKIDALSEWHHRFQTFLT